MRIAKDSTFSHLTATENDKIPRVKVSQTSIQPQGSLVYNTIDNLLYYSDGVSWIPVCTCDQIFIDQAQIDAAGGVLGLTVPGSYCLKEDVKGVLSLQSPGICLDLCCHTIDADGADNAIIISGLLVLVSNFSKPKSFTAKASDMTIANFDSVGFTYEKTGAQERNISSPKALSSIQNIKIFNGTIKGSAQNGILMQNVSDAIFSDLLFLSNALNGVNISSSAGVSLRDLTFLGDNGGERAILCTDSSNVSVSNTTITGFTSLQSSVSQFATTKDISFSNVIVSSNRKNTSSSIGGTDPEEAFVSFVACDGVELNFVKVNSNVFDTPLPSSNGFRLNEALYFVECINCSLNNCETNSNNDTAGNSVDNSTSDYFLFFILCNNCTVTNHKSNNNISAKIARFSSITTFDSNNMIFDKCQANYCIIAEMQPTFFSVHKGIWFTTSQGFILTSICNNNVLRNSQANHNTVLTGTPGRTNFGIFSAIHMTGANFIIDNCEASFNTMLDSVDLTFLAGIFISNGENALISNCSANNNVYATAGAGVDMGILCLRQMFSPPLANQGYARISNCQASRNGFGISIGILFPINQRADNVLIENCVANENLYDGIFIHDNLSGSKQVVIQDCILNENGGAGISVPASCVNSIMRYNTAIGNVGTGFDDLAPAGTTENSWFGNQSGGNALDYSPGVPPANISTYTKTTGVYAGGTAPNIYPTTNLILA